MTPAIVDGPDRRLVVAGRKFGWESWQSSPGDVQIPAEVDYTHQGVVIPEGTSPASDLRIDGAFVVCGVMKHTDGTLYLYYIGADGDRGDGGPAHRKLHVATSTDGLSWTKHPSNPIVAYSPNGGDEEGIFSGAFWTDGTTVYAWLGAMNNLGGPGSVDSSGDLYTSTDGVNFSVDTRGVIEPGTAPGDDEDFPFAAFEDGGTWYVYYIAKGSDVASWSVYLAEGPAANSLTTFTEVLNKTSDIGADIKGGGAAIQRTGTSFELPIGYEPNPHTYEMRSVSTASPTDASTIDQTYTFSTPKEGMIYLDRDLGTWFFYAITGAEDGIHAWTAPMNLV